MYPLSGFWYRGTSTKTHPLETTLLFGVFMHLLGTLLGKLQKEQRLVNCGVAWGFGPNEPLRGSECWVGGGRGMLGCPFQSFYAEKC